MVGVSPAVDRSPTETGTFVSVAVAVAAVLVLAVTSLPSVAATLVGTALLAVGLRRGNERIVTGGGCALFLGALVAGIGGGGVGPVLVGGALAVIAWDAAVNAIELGNQVGRAAETRSAELYHVAGTTAVAFATTAVAYALYAGLRSSRPITSVVLLTFAVVLLASALRVDPPAVTGE